MDTTLGSLNTDSSDRQSLLQIWRRERAYRVAKAICYTGLPLSLLAAMVDLKYSTWPAWAGDLLIFFSCILCISWTRLRQKKIQSKEFVWWPAYLAYWITSFGTMFETGGVNSPFFVLVLSVLFICGVIVQTRIATIIVFLFIVCNILLWAVLDIKLHFTPLTLPPLFVGSIATLGLAVVAACIGEMLRTEKFLMQEILDKHKELNNAREDLKREEIANAAKTNFLANISHELRTPLGAILGYTDLMQDKRLGEQDRIEYLDTIRRNGLQLARLVDDLLDITKVESGKIELEMVEFPPQQLFSEVMDLLSLNAKRKNLNFTLRYNSPVPETITSDPVRLKQILFNIIGNALKFTEKGTVEVLVEYNNQNLLVRVLDTGCGMTSEMQQKLFRPFSQADSSTSRKYGGTGLGLNLSRRLTDLLHGKLEIEKTVIGQGSAFSLSFPAPAKEDVHWIRQMEIGNKASTVLLKSNSEISLQGLRVLVVDDTPDNLNLIRKYLQKCGVVIDTATNGLEGVQKATRDDFDVILMDIQMPQLDGLEATRRLRKQKFRGKIIALTAHAMTEDKSRCLECGCDEYLTKPIQKSVLIERLSHVERLRPIQKA